MRRPRVVVGAIVALLLVVEAPGFAVTARDLRSAEDAVRGIQQELDDATEAYEATTAAIAAIADELELLRTRQRTLLAEANLARQKVGERARAVYMHGSTSSLHTLLSTGPESIERVGLIAALQRRDTGNVEDATASRISLAQIQLLVMDREQRLEEFHTELEVQADALAQRLAQAESTAGSIRSIVNRQRQISRGEQQGTYACIFDNAFSFRNTWGAPRSGGRRHTGTDVMAPYDHPVYAFTGGVVQRTSHSRLGGLGLYLRGDDGNVYYYAHLASLEPGGQPGSRVSAGQLVARNGYSGNATRSAPHVHFEIHPGGGRAVNPYPWLAAACW